jgi:hypothetical protein
LSDFYDSIVSKECGGMTLMTGDASSTENFLRNLQSYIHNYTKTMEMPLFMGIFEEKITTYKLH